MSNNLRSTFNTLSTVFSPACIAHEVLLGRDWTSVEVDGVTLPDALECWTSSLPQVVLDNLMSSEEVVFSSVPSTLGLARSQIKIDTVSSDGNFHNDLTINSKSPSMLADAPRSTFDYKLARNLVRNIATPIESAAERRRNSILNRYQPRNNNRKVVKHNRTDRRRISSRYSDTYFTGRHRNRDNENFTGRDERRRKQKRLRRRLRESFSSRYFKSQKCISSLPEKLQRKRACN